MADKILVQSTVLLITSLFGLVSGLIVYIWVSTRSDNAHKMNKLEKCVESHNDRLIILETEHENNHCKAVRKRK